MRHMLDTSRIAAIAIAAVFFITGIASAQTPPKIDVCSLLTKDQVKEAVGKTVEEGKLKANPNPGLGESCDFVVGGYGQFSIMVKTVGPEETADRTRSGLVEMKIPVADAPGIGDKSFFASPGYGMVQLNTFKGSTYLIITMLVPGVDEATQRTAAGKLMTAALTKL